MSKKRGITGDTDIQGKLRKQEAKAIAQAEEDIRAVMSTPAGRRFVRRIIFELAILEGLSYTVRDKEHSLFLEGRRAVGYDLKSDLQSAVPDLYLAMLAESVQADADELRRQKIAKTESEHEDTNE